MIEDQIEEYVARVSNEQDIDHSLNLFEHGYLSSLDILDLVSFIEETFEIEISDDDLNIDNLGSISSMARYVGRAKEG
jgi:acyl carrier protein